MFQAELLGETAAPTDRPVCLQNGWKVRGRNHKNDFRYERERDLYVCPAGEELTFRHASREKGRDMRKRKAIVEHPFGTIKRWMNQAYFLTRGIASVRGEFSLSAFAYNLKRVLAILGVPALLAAIR